MRRVPVILFTTLILAGGVFGVVRSVAHAAPTSTPSDGWCSVTVLGNYDCETTEQACAAKIHVSGCQQYVGGKPVQTSALEQQAQKQATDPIAGAAAILDWVMGKIMGLFALLVGASAIALDYAVFYTVYDMGNYINHIPAIGTTWKVLRDIGNIMLIFGFLAAGIATILNTERYGIGTKMLPMLLVAAVFINFSLFFGEAIVDSGNLVASQFYTQINGGNAPNAATSDGVYDAANKEVVSSALMRSFGLTTIYGAAQNPDVAKKVLQEGKPWYVGFMAILLFIVAAFVMFSLAFMLVSRFVMLLLLLIVAPIGFAGLALPMLSGIANKWWNTLIAQTITAPVLMLMLYVALKVITDPSFLLGVGLTSANSPDAALGFVTQNVAAFGSYLIAFLIGMGLLMAVTVIAKSISATGAGWATKTAGKLSFGATAWGMSKAVGLPSHYAARRIRTSSWAGTRTGRVLAGAFDRGATASFDVRSTKALKNLPGGGIDAGEAQKGGYRGAREKNIKAHEEYVKSIGKAYEERGEKPTKTEAADIARTLSKQDEATKAHGTVAEEKERIEADVKRYESEVAALTAEQKKDKYWGNDPKNKERMATAQQGLETSKAGLVTVTDAFKKASENLESATKAQEAAAKAPSETMKKQEKAAKEMYAGKIGAGFLENPGGWTVNLGMYGSGNSVAARKIRASLKEKGKDQKALDAMKAFYEEEAKKGGGEEKPKETEGKEGEKE